MGQRSTYTMEGNRRKLKRDAVDGEVWGAQDGSKNQDRRKGKATVVEGGRGRTCRDYFISFFSIPFIIFALLFPLPPSRNLDPGSRSMLFSAPTHYGSCLAFFFARRFQLFLPSSTRVELAGG